MSAETSSRAVDRKTATMVDPSMRASSGSCGVAASDRHDHCSSPFSSSVKIGALAGTVARPSSSVSVLRGFGPPSSYLANPTARSTPATGVPSKNAAFTLAEMMVPARTARFDGVTSSV